MHNRHIEYLKKERFYCTGQDGSTTYYCKTFNYTDDFLQPCIITPQGFITRQHYAKEFNKNMKLIRQGKLTLPCAMLLSQPIVTMLVKLAEHHETISFFYGDDNEHLFKFVSIQQIMQPDFYIEYGVNYCIVPTE